MVTLMLIVTAIDPKTGLRENLAVYNGAKNPVEELKLMWPMLKDRCPLLEIFRINTVAFMFSDEEKEFVSNLNKELEKINA